MTAALDLGAAALAFNFTLGVLTFFSPCGLPMLPAYVSYHLAPRGGDALAPPPGLARGMVGGLAAGAGAFLVLAGVGILAVLLGAPFKERVLLLELAGGVLVVAMGSLLLAGKDLSWVVPVRAAPTQGLGGLFAFGGLYSAVAAGCVAPVFLTGVFLPAVASGSVFQGAIFVASYALGMVLPLVVVTTLVATARGALVRRIQSLTPAVRKASGVVMILAGLYLIAFWVRVDLLL